MSLQSWQRAKSFQTRMDHARVFCTKYKRMNVMHVRWFRSYSLPGRYFLLFYAAKSSPSSHTLSPLILMHIHKFVYVCVCIRETSTVRVSIHTCSSYFVEPPPPAFLKDDLVRKNFFKVNHRRFSVVCELNIYVYMKLLHRWGRYEGHSPG